MASKKESLLKQLFKDNNDINEKSVVGFLAFLMMVAFAIADIITGYLGKPLVINDFIFDAFMWLVLGCFGIASVDKFVNKKAGVKEEEPVEEVM
jgi:hypothetical protein